MLVRDRMKLVVLLTASTLVGLVAAIMIFPKTPAATQRIPTVESQSPPLVRNDGLGSISHDIVRTSPTRDARVLRDLPY